MQLPKGKPTRSMTRLNLYIKVLRRAKTCNHSVTPLPAVKRRGKKQCQNQLAII
jgi:hypothetical protein